LEKKLNTSNNEAFSLDRVRWVGVEPTRLSAHGPQPCLSASSSTSAKVVVL
jgi:hypothetical protein